MKKTEMHETTFKLMVSVSRVTKKFSELENISINIRGEKVYPSELHILDIIGNGNSKNVTEISNQFKITKGAVSQVVNKLAEKGFLKKERSKGYGNKIKLSLTEKGWDAFKIQDDLHKKVEDEFFSYLGDIETEKIDSFMEIIVKIEELIDNFLRYDHNS